MLDTIFWHYSEYNNIDNDVIKSIFAELRLACRKMTTQEFDLVFSIVSSLCVEYERLAFMEGLRLGVVLMQEIFVL